MIFEFRLSRHGVAQTKYEEPNDVFIRRITTNEVYAVADALTEFVGGVFGPGYRVSIYDETEGMGSPVEVDA